MEKERVLCLDMSTKTGWALLVSSDKGCILEANGQIPAMVEPIGQYPANYIDWAYACFAHIVELIDQYTPDVLVIEETSSGSKNVYSQKILEWIHFLVAKMLKESNMRAVYIMSETWRRETGCRMNDAEKKKNKEVRDYKKKNDNTKVAYDKEGSRIGIVGRKHVNVRRANEVFGEYFSEPLKLKDEDTADSLLLGYCYHLRREKLNDKKSMA